ncbi:hypothetical protein MRX96_059823 [Rhipicephalus microplus]
MEDAAWASLYVNTFDGSPVSCDEPALAGSSARKPLGLANRDQPVQRLLYLQASASSYWVIHTAGKSSKKDIR